MRGGGLAATVSMVLVVVPRTANMPKDGLPPVQGTPTIASATAGDGCPDYDRYSSPEFQLYLQNLAPRCSDRMSRRVNEKLSSGFQIAVRRVCDIHECHDLFSQLGADGIDIMAATLYRPADPRRELQICNHAVTFTWVGASQTWLCRGFSKLSDNYAAMLLIHEALHCSGLPEDRNKGLSSTDIDLMVKAACDL